MAQYKIKNTDLYFEGKVVPEGSIIELPDNAAKLLMLYLEEVPNQVQSEKKSALKISKKDKEKTK
jgi:hypothetical protein